MIGMLLRCIAFAIGAWLIIQIGAPGVQGAEIIMTWSARLTTLLNALMGIVVVVGIFVAAVLASERGFIDSASLRTLAKFVRAIGYRVVPPATDLYDEASAVAGLDALGYPVDEGGGYGGITRRSVKRFQIDRGLRPTGWLDPATVDALAAASLRILEPDLPTRATGAGSGASAKTVATGPERVNATVMADAPDVRNDAVDQHDANPGRPSR
jgi:hypothetical protein